MDWVWNVEGFWQMIHHARVDVYDPKTDTWQMKANLPIPLGGKSTCSMDGKIYECDTPCIIQIAPTDEDGVRLEFWA